MTKHLVYKTTNLVNGKFYIGVHSAGRADYLGSGKALKAAVAKYGRSNFVREVIVKTYCSELAYSFEKAFVKETERNNYNLVAGGKGGGGQAKARPVIIDGCQYCSVNEAARQLKVSTTTVRNWEQNKPRAESRLKPCKVGSQTYSSIAEAARNNNRSESTIRRWLKSGKAILLSD